MIKIQVTEEDISRGLKGDCHKCPIALAAYKVLGDIFQGVTRDTIYYKRGDLIKGFYSNKIKQFVEDFDNGRKVEPFEFEIPEECIQ